MGTGQLSVLSKVSPDSAEKKARLRLRSESQKIYLELEFGAHIWWFSSAGEYFETV